MKICGIHGSPRGMHSRTRRLVSWVLEGAAQQGADVELIDLTDLRITPCSACERCSLTGQCIYADDFPSVFERMRAADGLVLGSPVYIDHVTGQLKVFIDRLADAIHYQAFTGKYGCAVSTTWNSGGEEVVTYLNHLLNYLGAYAVRGMRVAREDDEPAIWRAENNARDWGGLLADPIRNGTPSPEQEAIITENRAFFSRFVEENRHWRPREYEEWVCRGWIR